MKVKENFRVAAEINIFCIQITIFIIKAQCAISCHSGCCATVAETKVISYNWYSRDLNRLPPSSSIITIK